MAADKMDVLQTGPVPPGIEQQFGEQFRMHKLHPAADREAFLMQAAPQIRAIANFGAIPIASDFMQRLPKLGIVANVGFCDGSADSRWAGEHGVVVTDTPGVYDDEIADTAVALLLNTLRQLPQSERFLRAGKWLEKPFPLTVSTLRDRTIGMVGMGRIGQAVARRIETFDRPLVYCSGDPVAAVNYRHYPNLIAMARDVDTLVVIAPGNAAARPIVDRAVLEALGPNGVLINVAPGSAIDEDALIGTLRDKVIRSAGLTVLESEQPVPQELLDMDQVVLLPHAAAYSATTRREMAQLVVDNLKAWAEGKPPLTPVPETPWPPRKR